MRRLICALLALLILLCACGQTGSGEPGAALLLYYPAEDASNGGAFRTQDAAFDFSGLEDFLRSYLVSDPPAGAGRPIPAQWQLLSAVVQEATASLVFTGEPSEPLERSLSAACLAMTLLQWEGIQRVSLTTPGSAEPLLLSADDILLSDNGMLPQKEALTLYFPDEASRYLIREVQTVETMDAADKPAYIVNQLLTGRDRGQRSCIPEGTRLLSLSVENGVCTVNLSSQFQDASLSSPAAERMAVYSIVNSLTELPEIATVDFWVAGAPLEHLTWMKLTNGVARDEALLARPDSRDLLDVTLYPLCTDEGKLIPMPQMLELEEEQSNAELVLQALIQFEDRNGLRACVPGGTKPLSVRLEGGVCMVDLTGEFLDGCTGAAQETAAVHAIVASLCDLPEISSVEILVEGLEPVYRNAGLHAVQTFDRSWLAE